MKKKNTSLIVSIVIIVVLAIVLIFALGNKDSGNNSENLAINTPSNGVVSNNLEGISSGNSEVISSSLLSVHNSKEDCWIAYKGKVYDVTAFLPKHEGSAGAIIPYCGTSSGFEEAFTKQHGTSKASMLMKVGVLIGDFENMGSLE